MPTLIHIGSLIIQISDAINIGLITVTVLGLSLTARQIMKGSAAERATFLKDLYLMLTSDDMLRALSMVEYGRLTVTAEGEIPDES